LNGHLSFVQAVLPFGVAAGFQPGGGALRAAFSVEYSGRQDAATRLPAAAARLPFTRT
jgi:hypothetical protein